MSYLQKQIFLLLLPVFICSIPTFASDDAIKNKISDKVDELDYLRDELAMKAKLSLENDKKYQEACEVIQKNSEKMARQTGWEIRQPSKKARNSSNKKISTEEQAAFDKFKDSPRLGAYWFRTENGFWYFRQIKTETKCLACHGPSGNRPQEVKDRYPGDRAHGFKDGEFYGIFSVHVPDKNKAKKDAKPKVKEEPEESSITPPPPPGSEDESPDSTESDEE